MKKLLSIAVCGVMVVALVPGTSAAGKRKKQTVKGSVLAAARHPDGCYSGVHRRVQAVTTEANGAVGYDFDVTKGTWNKPFVMKLTEGLGTVDLDITYYLGERTKAEDFVAQGGDPAVPPTVGYETREEGGEAGTVPKGAIWAIVCIYESEGGVGAQASFTYKAGKGVKLPK